MWRNIVQPLNILFRSVVITQKTTIECSGRMAGSNTVHITECPAKQINVAIASTHTEGEKHTKRLREFIFESWDRDSF